MYFCQALRGYAHHNRKMFRWKVSYQLSAISYQLSAYAHAT
ncbi:MULTISPECIES: hypothetical protein [unclassified Moorena]|nr:MULTISPECIES: hypothetical protein [unclassified Moorena]